MISKKPDWMLYRNCTKGRYDAVKKHLTPEKAKSININATREWFAVGGSYTFLGPCTLLMAASINGHLALAQLLIEQYGADLNVLGARRKDYTALDCAIRWGKSDPLVNYLESKGAKKYKDIKVGKRRIVGDEETTSLIRGHQAIAETNLSSQTTVEMQILKSGKMEETDFTDDSLDITRESMISTVKDDLVLLQKLNELKNAIKRGNSYAAKVLGTNKKEICKLLEFIDENKRTLIHLAVMDNEVSRELLSFLILQYHEHKFEDLLVLPDAYSNSLLHLAALADNVKAIEILKTNKTVVTSVNFNNCQGKTALFIAVERAQFKIVDILLREFLAEIDIKSNRNDSVLDVVNDIKNEDVRKKIKFALKEVKKQRIVAQCAKIFRNQCKIPQVGQINIKNGQFGKDKFKDTLADYIAEFLFNQTEFAQLINRYKFNLPTDKIEDLARIFAATIQSLPVKDSKLSTFKEVARPRLIQNLIDILNQTAAPSLLSMDYKTSVIVPVNDKETEFKQSLEHVFNFKVSLCNAIEQRLVCKPTSSRQELLTTIEECVKNLGPSVTNFASCFIPSEIGKSAVQNGGTIAAMSISMLIKAISNGFASMDEKSLMQQVKVIKHLFWDFEKGRPAASIRQISDQMLRRYKDQINLLTSDNDIRKLSHCIYNRIISHILAGKNIYIGQSNNSVLRQLENFSRWANKKYSTRYHEPDLLPLTERCILALYYERAGRDNSVSINNRSIHGFLELSGIKVWNERMRTYSYYANSEVSPDIYGYCEASYAEAIKLRGFKLVVAPTKTASVYTSSALLTANSGYMSRGNQRLDSMEGPESNNNNGPKR